MDQITLEIIKGKLLSTADEMAVVLARTSMLPVSYEVLDFEKSYRFIVIFFIININTFIYNLNITILQFL